MLLQKRINRAMEYSAKQRKKEPLPGEEYDPKAEIEQTDLGDQLEKGDWLAMLLAALVTILPIALAALLILAGVGFLLLRL